MLEYLCLRPLRTSLFGPQNYEITERKLWLMTQAELHQLPFPAYPIALYRIVMHLDVFEWHETVVTLCADGRQYSLDFYRAPRVTPLGFECPRTVFFL